MLLSKMVRFHSVLVRSHVSCLSAANRVTELELEFQLLPRNRVNFFEVCTVAKILFLENLDILQNFVDDVCNFDCANVSFLMEITFFTANERRFHSTMLVNTVK